MSRARSLAFLLGPVALVLGACGGGDAYRPKLFSTDWQDDGGASIARVRAKIQGASAPKGVDVAVGVASQGDKIVVQPLDGGPKWQLAHKLDARPFVAGELVFVTGGGETVALDAKSGKKLWAYSSGKQTLWGAGDDGRVTVLSLSKEGGSELVVIGRDGGVRRSVSTDKSLGVPAVLGGYAFVPWGNQYVTAYEIATGDEVARVTFREKVSRAWEQGGQLYFGEVGVFRFDDRIRDASKNGASHLVVPQRELPGTPRLLVPGGERAPVAANALDRTRLYGQPTTGEAGGIAWSAGRVYATYYRLVMGLDAQRGNIAWVHTHDGDVLGGESLANGVAVCDDKGKVTVLDARSGGVVSAVDLGEPLRACVVSADGLRAAGAPKAVPVLADQLHTALVNREAQLATAQRLLIRELAGLPDEKATKTLIDLASDPNTAPVLVADARAALAGRRTGAAYMKEALAKHYDFLHDVLLSPPVGPIAQALAAMNDAGASALLASHIVDPADTDDDVKHATAALVPLGSAKEVPMLQQFITLHRASPETDDIMAAVVSASQAVLKHGGKDGKTFVAAVAADATTFPSIKPRLDALLAGDGKDAPGAAPSKADPPKPTAPKKK